MSPQNELLLLKLNQKIKDIWIYMTDKTHPQGFEDLEKMCYEIFKMGYDHDNKQEPVKPFNYFEMVDGKPTIKHGIPENWGKNDNSQN